MYTNQIPADPTAVMGKRIGAFLINFAILVVVVFVCARAFADFKSEDIPAELAGVDVCELIRSDSSISLCFESDDMVVYATGANAAFWTFGAPTIVALLNSVVLAAITGASIGKHIFGLRVVKQATGAVAGFGSLLVRWLLWIVDGFPWCFPLVGLITGLATKNHRRVGDMAAGTVVVAKSSVGTPVLGAAQPAGWSPPPAPGGYAAPPPSVDPWTPTGPPVAPSSDPWGSPEQPSTTPVDPWAPPSPPSSSVEPSAPGDPWAAPSPPAPTPSEERPQPEMDDWAAPSAPEATEQRGADPEPSAPAVDDTIAMATGGGDTPPSTPATTEPQWDAARNAYIQWEPVSGQWMQFDDAAQQWRPLT